MSVVGHTPSGLARSLTKAIFLSSRADTFGSSGCLAAHTVAVHSSLAGASAALGHGVTGFELDNPPCSV